MTPPRPSRRCARRAQLKSRPPLAARGGDAGRFRDWRGEAHLYGAPALGCESQADVAQQAEHSHGKRAA